jgi:hypothetical protein
MLQQNFVFRAIRLSWAAVLEQKETLDELYKGIFSVDTAVQYNVRFYGVYGIFKQSFDYTRLHKHTAKSIPIKSTLQYVQ